jgi:hypothetical protein
MLNTYRPQACGRKKFPEVNYTNQGDGARNELRHNSQKHTYTPLVVKVFVGFATRFIYRQPVFFHKYERPTQMSD